MLKIKSNVCISSGEKKSGNVAALYANVDSQQTKIMEALNAEKTKQVIILEKKLLDERSQHQKEVSDLKKRLTEQIVRSEQCTAELKSIIESQQAQIEQVQAKIVEKRHQPENSEQPMADKEGTTTAVVSASLDLHNLSLDDLVSRVASELTKGNDNDLPGKKTSSQSQVSYVNNVRREYKLTKKVDYEYFMDYLTSELRSNDLLYVIDKKVKPYGEKNEKLIDFEKYKAIDVIMSRIDPIYYKRINKMKDPVEMLEKLRKIKLAEVNVTSGTLRKTLYSIKYCPHKESANDFCERFEALVADFESVADGQPISEEEQRDAFYNAICQGVASVAQVNFLRQREHGTSLTYEELKEFVVQEEARKQGSKEARPVVMLARPRSRFSAPCKNCLSLGHTKNDCRNEVRCRTCFQVGHMSTECVNTEGSSYNGWAPKRGRFTVSRRAQGRFHLNSYTNRGGHNWRGNFNHRSGGDQPSSRGGRTARGGHTGLKSQSTLRGGNSRGGHTSGPKRGQKGRFTPNARPNEGKVNALHIYNKSSDYGSLSHSNNNSLIEKFIADSGATEHLAKSALIFKEYDGSYDFKIKSANKSERADLEVSGIGTIGINLNDKSSHDLENVICAKDLSINLLSLRKFVDQGLSVYLNDKIINIFDPVTSKTFLKGIYKQPFWEIELQINSPNVNKNNKNKYPPKVYVNLTELEIPKTHDYNLRNKETPEEIENAREIDPRLSSVSMNVSEESENEITEVPNTDSRPDLLVSFQDRKLHEINQLPQVDLTEKESSSLESAKDNKLYKLAVLWHARLGHASVNYLKEFQKNHEELVGIKGLEFYEAVKDCEVCKIAKFKRKPFNKIRARATRPLEVINADIMGPISPVSYPKGYRYISVFIDNFSRLAMAYPMKSKSETGECLESFVKSARNLYGAELKVCYLETDQGTEFTGGYTRVVLDNLNAELKLACPDTPQHNGVAERFNQTIQNKVRAYMYDSKMPENSWDLCVYAATYAYNRTPHAANNMIAPIKIFASHYNIDLKQIRRFGCLAYVGVHRKVGPKFRFVARRVIFVGYTRTGYLLLMPEEGKFYESRNVDFNEKLVYGDKYNTQSIKDWLNDDESIEKSKWFIEFEKESESSEEISKTEGVAKRGRGRPRKDQTINSVTHDESVNLTYAMYILNTHENHDETKLIEIDKKCYALLADMQDDPRTVAEAIKRVDGQRWLESIKDELESMDSNQVWTIVDRPTINREGQKPNIIDSRWVFKSKLDENGIKTYKARLVIRGFKDTNEYDLRETYAPVSRMPLIRSFLAIVNKYDLDMYQLDVKTAFLNGKLDVVIYMEIPDGVYAEQNKPLNKVCLLHKALYGLRISPKKWNERFTEVITRTGLARNSIDPCLFTWHDGEKAVYLLLYVDDILLAGNDKIKLNQVKKILKDNFEIKDLGEPKEFLSMRITRDRISKTLTVDQEKFIKKLANKFCPQNKYPHKTPMITERARNQGRISREDSISSSDYLPKSYPYREGVGSLLYIANTVRPDISYSINVLSRHQICPTFYEWEMLIRVIKYLIGTADKKLTFRGNGSGLVTYADASFADCKDALTTSGYVIKLFGDTVAWRTHKLSYVSLSTCQAEYVSMSEAGQAMLALTNSLKLMLKIQWYPLTLYCDNKAAISCSKKEGSNKLRHVIETKDHFIRQCVYLNLIDIKWIPTKSQLADIFTKALPLDAHDFIMNQLFN